MINSLSYPVRGIGPWLLGGFSILGWMLMVILRLLREEQPDGFVFALLFLSPAAYVLVGMLVGYAFVVLLHTARGHPRPPTVDVPDLNPMRQLHVLVVLALAVAISAAAHGIRDDTGSLVVIGLAILFGSGFITLTALNSAIGAGFSIADHRRLIRGLGPEGIGLLVVGAAWLGLAWTLIALSAGPLTLLVVAYLFILAHHLGGRLLYRHRLALELATELSPEQTHTAEWMADQQAFRALLNDLHRLCGTDQVVKAHDLLNDYIAEDAGLDERSVYLALGDFQDQRLRLEHAYHYIGRLVRAQDRPGAWGVLCDAAALDPQFRPETDEQLVSLASLATPEDAPVLEVLLKDFDRRFPDSHLKANAMFRLAVARIEHLDAAWEGRALLDRIRREYPEFAGQQRFRDYQTRIDTAPR